MQKVLTETTPGLGTAFAVASSTSCPSSEPTKSIKEVIKMENNEQPERFY